MQCDLEQKGLKKGGKYFIAPPNEGRKPMEVLKHDKSAATKAHSLALMLLTVKT